MAGFAIRFLGRLYNALPVVLQRAILVAGHHRFLVGVIGIGVDPRGRIVLGRHRFGSSAWRFLGGLLQPHEDPSTSLAREVREEIGLEAEIGPLLAVGNSGRWAHVEIVYAYRVAGPLPGGASRELLEVASFAVDALPPIRAEHRDLIAQHGPAAVAWALSRGPRGSP